MSYEALPAVFNNHSLTIKWSYYHTIFYTLRDRAVKSVRWHETYGDSFLIGVYVDILHNPYPAFRDVRWNCCYDYNFWVSAFVVFPARVEVSEVLEWARMITAAYEPYRAMVKLLGREMEPKDFESWMLDFRRTQQEGRHAGR